MKEVKITINKNREIEWQADEELVEALSDSNSELEVVLSISPVKVEVELSNDDTSHIMHYKTGITKVESVKIK